MFALLARFLKRQRTSTTTKKGRAGQRGSADLSTYLLLTAAGCAMCSVVAPHLMKSSKTASKTFDEQVNILQRGSSPGAGASGMGAGGGFDIGGMISQIGSMAGGSSGGGSSSGGNTTPAATTEPAGGSGPIVTNNGGSSGGSGKSTGGGKAPTGRVAPNINR